MGKEPNTGAGGNIAMEAKRLRLYKRKVQSLHDRLQRLGQSFSGNKIDNLSAADIDVRLDMLAEMREEFNKSHNELESLDEDEIGSELRETFDTLFISLKAELLAALELGHLRVAAHSTSMPNSSGGHTIIMAHKQRLPELKLPSFSGGYVEYADFIAMLNSVIEGDADLSEIEKFQHLRSCLSDAALDSVRSLELSSANYRVALDILGRRFNNKRLVFQAHIKEILGLKKVDSHSAKRLREFSDAVNLHTRALQTLGSAEEISGCMIIHMLLQKLDEKTQTKWEETASSDRIPTAGEFYDFLEK
ncbi:uncharacterized protein LOC121404354 [Drosophila obscura]|uniref:uncharacterized protein LOC121404354 n=1 Tax=Drosophila obscura TaxID=7282 RepID=UPI001BB2A971|nr:uncharacterized protein LOC121404354 [Drosophila obscura]